MTEATLEFVRHVGFYELYRLGTLYFVVRYLQAGNGDVFGANIWRADHNATRETEQPWHSFTPGMDTDAAREIMRRLGRA